MAKTRVSPVTIRNRCQFTGRVFSLDSAKAIKANDFGWLNAIMYMAPANLAGVGNLCSHAAECIAPCLGWESGQAGMVKNESDLNSVRRSRIERARAFMKDRAAFMRYVAVEIARTALKARKLQLQLCVRLNGSTDIAWEGIAVDVDSDTATVLASLGIEVAVGRYRNAFELFPSIQFVDYTKNPHRMRRKLPANYHLTFSRMASNESTALEILQGGANVAAVFAGALPSIWQGFPVINGDTHDLRHLDPRGVVVGLTPKGNKAKRDSSGFVIRNAAAPLQAAA
jgi:hypothetical protein